MKTGLLICARMGSSRLPRKHLMEVNGKPLISYQVGRIHKEFAEEMAKGEVELILCSPDEPASEAFRVVEGVKLFLGDTRNIPKRHVQAADAFGLDQIVNIDGDDILFSTTSMRRIYNALMDGANYVYTHNMPTGMNSLGYKTAFLKRCMEPYMDTEVIETGWGRVFDDRELQYLESEPEPDQDLLRITLDYQEDVEFFRAVITALGDKVWEASDQLIYDTIRKNKFYEINAFLSDAHSEYFKQQYAKEGEQL